MLLIFVGSTDLLSNNRTSRLIGPLLRWLVPGISEESIQKVQYAVRKGGHVSEYAVLALLSYRALRRVGNHSSLWNRRTAAAALTIAAVYAGSDEFHQWFVATRYASVLDVLIDTAGAAAGIALLWGWSRLRANRPAQPWWSAERAAAVTHPPADSAG